MAYSKIYISGDTHGDFTRFLKLKDEENIAVIVLGDTAVNWNLTDYDRGFKWHLKEKYPNITWYLLRGNHDGRPENLMTILTDYDDEFDGYVMYEPDFLHIRYLLDGGEYTVNDYKILTIGGAYSVDKWYRLEMGRRWFADEQLTKEEMNYISDLVKGKSYDFVLTHTCPYEWRPTDLFLHGLDQSTVDNTMELWLQELKNTFDWNIWLFGHYHADRLERPHVEQLYQVIENIDDIWDRWNEDDEIDWWLRKSPHFYWED